MLSRVALAGRAVRSCARVGVGRHLSGSQKKAPKALLVVIVNFRSLDPALYCSLPYGGGRGGGAGSSSDEGLR